MTGSDIATTVRRLIDDPAAHIWSDSQILDAINEIMFLLVQESPDLHLSDTGYELKSISRLKNLSDEVPLPEAWFSELVHHACAWLMLIKSGNTENQARASIHMQIRERLGRRR